MREIKFRGKRKDNDKWVYGYYIYRNCVNNDTHYIAVRAGLYHEVIPETVSQFTGLKDKNGKEIYEGDIVKLSYGIPPTHDNLIIEYADDENVADISVSGWWMRNIRENGCSSSLCKTYENDIEIIGNKWDNPELLE